MEKKQWHDFAFLLREVFSLETSPVAVKLIKQAKQIEGQGKIRVCRAILDTAKGKTHFLYKENNACFGAAWHMGFHQIKNPKVREMTRKFVVEGEKLFASHAALDNLMSQFEEVPDNSGAYFLLSPLEVTEEEPDIVVFVCNAEAASRILTFVTFRDGTMPKIKIGGPTCRMAIMYPLLTGEVNISFYDYTARKLCNMEKDKLLVSVPYKRIPQIIEDIDKCSAGRAKIEFPPEFREFLRKRLAK